MCTFVNSDADGKRLRRCARNKPNVGFSLWSMSLLSTQSGHRISSLIDTKGVQGARGGRMRTGRQAPLAAMVLVVLTGCAISPRSTTAPFGCALRSIDQSEWSGVWIATITTVHFSEPEFHPHVGRTIQRDFTLLPQRTVRGMQITAARRVSDLAAYPCGPEPALQIGDRVAVYERRSAGEEISFVMVYALAEAERLDPALRRLR